LPRPDLVIEEELRSSGRWPMTLEARGLMPTFQSATELSPSSTRTIPFQMQEVFSKHLKIPEHKVRVIAPDIGGGFGMKLNL